MCITTAMYLTPKGRDVDKEKILPNIALEPSEDDIKNDNDVQLKRAVQFLKERLGASQAKSENQGHG